MPLYVRQRQALIVFLLLVFSSSAMAAPLPERKAKRVSTSAAPEIEANISLVSPLLRNPFVVAATYNRTGPSYSQPLPNQAAAKSDGRVSPFRAVAETNTSRRAKVYKIMPLGDSNTEGTASFDIAEENRVAYRDRLEELLDGSALKGLYDFVGSESTGSAYMSDTDHAGFGGARDEDIATLLRDGEYSHYGEYMRGPGGGSYLDKYSPDIILLHIGTNSVWDTPSDVSDVADILDQIDAYEKRKDKEVTVILAKIILSDGRDSKVDDDTKTYNDAVSKLVKERVEDGDDIVLVDMQDGARLNYTTETGGDMADQLHPNAKGYAKMAKVWFDALQKIITPDTQAPETTIDDKPAAISNKSAATFRFASNDDDVIYEASLDNAAFGKVTNPYTLSGLSDGKHTLRVRAKNQAGTTDPSPASHTWTIDTQAPATPVVSAPTEGAMLNNSKPAITGTAEAGSNVTLYIGNKQLGLVTAETDGKWRFVPTTALDEGNQLLTAKATDAAGNTSNASSARRFTIDSKAPETNIASKPAATTNKSEAIFSFGSTETGVTYWVSLDGAAFAVAPSPYTASNLQDGAHTLSVRAVDAAGNPDASPASFKWIIDTKAPEAPVFSGITEDRGPKANDQVTADNAIRITGEGEPNATVRITEEGAELGTTTASASGNWEFNHENTPLTQGTHTFTATATDAAGNTSGSSAAFAVTIDVTAPDVSISKAADAPLNAAFNIRIQFTEEVYNLAAADFEVTNGVISNLSASGKGIYTASVTPAAEGKVQVSLPAGKATDLAGNPNRASNLLETVHDATRPRLSLSSDAPAAVNAAFPVTFTFSEAVSGFDVSDIAVTNGSASNFNVLNATTYTAQVTPGADGEVSVKVAADKAFDKAKNGNEASAALKRIYDVQQPAVVLSTTAPNPTKAPFTVTVTFSEEIKAFAAGDMSLTNASASQVSKVNNRVYTVLVTPVATGEVAVGIAADVVQDMASNGNLASNELRLRYDADRPAVTAGTTAPAFTNKPFTVTFRISEPISGFELADIVATNATAENLKKESEQEYSVLLTPSADGKVAVSVPANKMQDAATNGNTASNVLELTYDATGPTGYTVRFGVEKVDVTNQANVSLEIEGAETGATYAYSIRSSNGEEAMTGTAQVTASDFTVPNLDFTALRDGQLTVVLFLTDAVGNKGTEATAQVEKLTKNIEAVQALAAVRVKFKTDFEDVPLPKKVEVTYTNGEKDELNVTWQKETYDGSKPGLYTLVGELELKENTSNLGNKAASLTVEVEPNQPPTNISLSKDTFDPNIESHVTIGAFSTTDPDDADFIYEMVAGEGDAHNQLFEITNGNELTLKSNKGLSGVSTFHIRIRSTDPYQNYIEKTFTLTKSLYHPESKIKLVNAFSPDGDGTNDTWTVPELRFYNEIEVEVFDRAGVRLFHSTNPEEGWDGRGADGRILKGSYFYIIQIKDINLVQKGVLTVLN